MKFICIKIFIFMIAIPLNAFAITACGIVFPKNSKNILSFNENCEVSVDPKFNATGLNYFFINSFGIKKLLEDETIFLKNNNRIYFTNEEVSDSKINITILDQKEARLVYFHGGYGYMGSSVVFIQNLSENKVDKKYSNSGKFNCIEIAKGDSNHSIHGRFCLPSDKDGKIQYQKIKDMLEKIEFNFHP